MKKSLLFLLIAAVSTCARSQTFTVVNRSASAVNFKVGASDKNSCDPKYTSATTMIDPGAEITYSSASLITWAGVKPANEADYTFLEGMYMDPSGSCVSKGANRIGSVKCGFEQKTTIDVSKCGGTGSNLHLSWSVKNDNISVTIN